MNGFIEILFLLLIAHAFSDIVFQSDNMAKRKKWNVKIDLSSIPKGQKVVKVWFHYLIAHCLISAGCLLLITDLPIYFGLIEFCLHLIIDIIKIDNRTNPNQDQLLHILTKILYSIIYVCYLV